MGNGAATSAATLENAYRPVASSTMRCGELAPHFDCPQLQRFMSMQDGARDESMNLQANLLEYYGARATEYEKVYAKPERQADLRRLHELVPERLSGRRVLDVACGTGYWTRRIAARATAVTGCDVVPEVLAVARAEQPPNTPTDFVIGDAFALDRIPGAFDAGFVGFWWSHIVRTDLARFLTGLHRRLGDGSRVVIVDNRYVAGSNWPITRTDTAGNTYQRRHLENGAEHEVLKNFPSLAEVWDAIGSAGGDVVDILELEYYWCATYDVVNTV